MEEAKPKDHARVIAPPPLLALLCVGAGFAADYFYPIAFIRGVDGGRRIAALTLYFIAAGIIFAALKLFAGKRENPDPYAPTTTIFESGIYRFTRNPIYLGLLIVAAAVAVQSGSAWLLLSLAALFLLLHFGVVLREERYLAAKFPDTYPDYRRRVRRWL
jgi:protein-S-isoprenylcysteine O-methyltransferase Ste14